MPGVLVDSNVLLDVLTEDPQWYGWSSSALARSPEHAALVINPIIYAEVSVRFARIEELDDALPADLFRREGLPRRRGGARRSPLPDFFIGAHAAISQFGLLTRDPTRYRTYFPNLKIPAPG